MSILFLISVQRSKKQNCDKKGKRFRMIVFELYKTGKGQETQDVYLFSP